MKFPVTLTPDQEDGGYVVSFRDIPEATSVPTLGRGFVE